MDDFEKLSQIVSNWGRWGEEDQLGCLNLITPDVIVRSVQSVKQGKVFSLGLDFNRNGPQQELGNRFNPHLYMSVIGKKVSKDPRAFAFSDDVIHMPSQCATQWDALSHVQYENKLYNGFDASVHIGAFGARRDGIENPAIHGVVSRAVLLDIARLKGVDRLDANYIISPDDLENAKSRQGVAIEQGDIVLIRTGHIGHFTIDGNRDLFMNNNQPGLSYECARWLHDHNLAALAADNVAIEKLPSTLDFGLPLHMLCLRDMGLMFGEMFNLEALAADCESDGEWTCQLSAPPLRVTGAVGSPINPIALK